MTFEKAAAIGRWLRRRAENVAVALLALMFICFILQIVYRYVLDDPLGWTEEVIIVTWLWSVLWGAAFVVGEAEEIRFDIIYTRMPETFRRASTVMTGVALILLYGISLPAAYRYVAFMQRRTLGLSARADRPALLHLYYFLRRLHLPLLLAGLSRHSRRQVSRDRSGQGQ